MADQSASACQVASQPTVAGGAEVDRAQVSPDVDLLAGQRPPDPQLPPDQLLVPAGGNQHLQLHRPRIGCQWRWVHIAGHDQARLAWAALAGRNRDAGTAMARA